MRRLLNDPLFLKTPKGVVPTERAKELEAPIRDVLARVRTVISTAEPFDPARSRRRFTIGTADGFSVFLPPLLDEIARTAPGIDLVVRHMQMETALSDLDGRLIDVAIAPFYELPARFAAQRLYEDDFVIAAQSRHPFLKNPTLENYCRMQHLLVAPRGDPSGIVDELLESRGLSRRVALAVPNFMLALDLLTKTQLVCVLPKRFVERHAERFAVATASCRWISARPPFRRWRRRQRSWTAASFGSSMCLGEPTDVQFRNACYSINDPESFGTRAGEDAHRPLDGRQAKEAPGDDWKGWWPDDDGGDDDGGSPAPQNRRRPDVNRAAVGLAGSAAAPITTLSSSSWAHSPRSIQGNRFERRFCYGDSEGESGFKRQYRTFVWLINDKGLRHAAERNLSRILELSPSSGDPAAWVSDGLRAVKIVPSPQL